VGSRFSPLGEEESDSESCSSEVPFEAALQVLDGEGAVEEIADAFWEEIGLPKGVRLLGEDAVRLAIPGQRYA
jgi:hypothetical protein